MSGHSHWAGIKHRKGINDAKKAVFFTKAGRDITIAAQKGGDPDKNFSLRMAIDAARAVNLPKENIERAIKKGTGELEDGARIEELLYEGFGPHNVALLVSAATDNKNRTVSEVKSFFTKNNGKFGASGSVAFLFQKVGELLFNLTKYDLALLEEAILETNALDFSVVDEELVLYTEYNDLENVRRTLEVSGFSAESARLSYKPLQTVSLSGSEKEAVFHFIEKLEDEPDVQEVWSNLAS